MNHADVKSYLPDYLEGDLSLDLRAVVDGHLDGCAECAAEVREMQQTILLLRTMPAPELPDRLADRVMRRIRAGDARPGLLERLGRVAAAVLEPGFVLPATVLGAAALVFVVVQDPGALTRPGLDWLGAGGSDLAAIDPGAGSRVASQASGGGAASEPQLRIAVPRGEWRVVTEPIQDGAGRVAASGTRVRIRLESPAGGGALPLVEARSRGLLSVDAQRAGMLERAESITSGAMLPSPWSLPGALRGGGDRSAGPAETDGLGLSTGGFGVLGPELATGVSDRLPLLAESSGGEDPRDAWLARGLREPVQLAHYLTERSLAEQELWLNRLTERAAARGVLDALIAALRDSGDRVARVIAEDFAAEAQRLEGRRDRAEAQRLERRADRVEALR